MGNVTSVPKNDSSLLRSHSRGLLNRLLTESEASLALYHVGFGFRIVQIALICCMRLITAASYIILLTFILLPVQPKQVGGELVYCCVLAFCCVEALFLPYYVALFRKVSEKRPLVHYCATREERREFFQQCILAMNNTASSYALQSKLKFKPESYIQQAVEGWFFGTSIENIYKENFNQWVHVTFLIVNCMIYRILKKKNAKNTQV